MLSKLQLSIKNFFASITNTKPISPINLQKKVDKIFIPTLESGASMLFWLSWVIFLACYGLAIQADKIDSMAQFYVMFAQYLLHNFLIIFFNVGYAFFTIHHLSAKTPKQITIRMIGSSLFITPVAVSLANFLLEYYFAVPFDKFRVLIYIVVSTLTMMIALILLLKHFNNFQNQSARQHRLHQQALIEQNEQIKARITPHFFFNMLNTVQYLIEEDPCEAENMLRSVSNLYRTSFNGSQEIGFLDEVDICKHYLKIESYRFAEKLQVEWDLPDEDMLYDMTISSLTLQLAIEKMIIFVVENNSGMTYINIGVKWQNNKISVMVKASVLGNFSQNIQKEIEQKLNFNHQIHILQEHYGKQANIYYQLENASLTTHIEYPFYDVAI